MATDKNGSLLSGRLRVYEVRVVMTILPPLGEDMELLQLITGTFCFIVLFYSTLDIVFLQIEVLWQHCVEQVYWQCHFFNSICSFHVSVSYFGNPNFSI